MKDAEFLSGFSKEDKIIPVITLTVYFGSDKWDGPRSLKDMFPDDIDEEMLIKNVNTLMNTLNTNLDGACKALQISVQEYEDAKKWLE